MNDWRELSSFDIDELLTTGDVAKLLNTNVATIHNYINRGILTPDYVIPSASGKLSRRKFKQETVDAFLKSCGIQPDNTERLLSAGEVAIMLGVTVGAVQDFIKMGMLEPDVVLPGSQGKKSGRRKFKVSTVAAFAESYNIRRRVR